MRLADRELLDLRYAPGAAVKDIALQLGRPANSVCKSLGRIRRALWNCINEELVARGGEGMIDVNRRLSKEDDA